MGVVWITGKDVEPIVFTLGTIRTLLFASPAIARYALPDEIKGELKGADLFSLTPLMSGAKTV
jgi:hypothetical protein